MSGRPNPPLAPLNPLDLPQDFWAKRKAHHERRRKNNMARQATRNWLVKGYSLDRLIYIVRLIQVEGIDFPMFGDPELQPNWFRKEFHPDHRSK